jgi:hypothetical protein
MKWKLALALSVFAGMALADTLTLKNGKVVQGTFLGADTRNIRMMVGNEIQTFLVTDSGTLVFGDGVVGSVPAAGANVAQSGAGAQGNVPATQTTGTSPLDPLPPAAASAATTGSAVGSGASTAAAPTTPTASSGSASTASSAPASVAAVTGIEVPAGQEVVIRMIDSVDSEVNREGQVMRASLDQPIVVNGRTVAARGADVTVRLASVEESGKLTGKSELALVLDTIDFQGRKMQVVTPEVSQTSESRTGQTAKVVGGTAALGAIIGAIAGGGKGAAIGAATGAGAGAAVQVVTRGPKVKIPSETRLTFSLQSPIRL